MRIADSDQRRHQAQRVLAIFALVLACAGCSDVSRTVGRDRPAPGSGFIASVENMELTTDAALSGVANLQDGYFEEAAAPGSASKTRIRLADRVYGDLTSDGIDDAALIVITDSGGSGIYSHVAVAINENESAAHVGSILLGDRVRIESLEVSAGTVVVSFLTRGPGDSMAAVPTKRQTRSFFLRDGRLVEAD